MEPLERLAKGQGLVEYALILVLVSVVVIVILALLGPSVGNVFSTIVENIQPTEAVPEPPAECYGTILLPLTLLATAAMVLLSNYWPNPRRPELVIV